MKIFYGSTITIICYALIIFVKRVNAQHGNSEFGKEQKMNGVKIGNCFINSGNGKEKCIFPKNNLDLNNDDIELNFQQSNKKIKCIRKQIPNGKGWYGNCGEDAQDANFIKRNGKIFGSIRIGTDICQISPGPNNVEEIECTPQDDFPDESEALDGDENGEPCPNRLLRGAASTVHQIKSLLRSSSSTNHNRQLYDDSGSNLDVLVVWTKEAECAYTYNGVTSCTVDETTENNMLGLIDLAVSESNIAFTVSGINTQIRLVHAYRHPTYTERGFTQALTDVRKDNDGYMDDVHDKRNLYGADFVHMIVASNSYCGLSYGGTGSPISSSFAFSVSRYTCSTGYFSFSHEIAHNIGAAHDRGTEGDCDTVQFPSIKYGYRDPAGSFRSIMAYHCSTNQCDSNAGGTCTRVQMFSTPNQLYDGTGVIGDANNNVAQYINNNLYTVANYRPAVNCQNDNECNDNDSNTVDTCNLNNNMCVYTPLPPPPPSPAPTLPPGNYMESMMVSSVKDWAWTTIPLSTNYVSPIPVCTVQYGTVSGANPAVVRMRNVGTSSFEIRLQYPGDAFSTGIRNVHCVVVEEGQWFLPDGRKVEAQKYLSTVTDKTSSWPGEVQSYLHTYTQAPIVLGQVMTFNDPLWSTFWARGLENWKSLPSTAGFRAGKHVGDDPNVVRSDETVGMIIMEMGRATSDGVDIETGRTANTIDDFVTNGATNVLFTTPFANAPAVTVASKVGVNGAEGTWTVLGPDATSTSFNVAVDEDAIIDDRVHTTEHVDYVVFSSADPIALSTSGTTQAPVPAPTAPPTSAPQTIPPSSDYMESLVATDVGSSWQTISLSATYVSPVVVCSPKYSTASYLPAVVRIRNVGSTSFEIRLQNPGDINTILARDCHCLVAEEGNWVLPDGRKMEARTYLSTVTDCKINFVGQQQSYQNTYTSPPVILGQVMTYNDPKWSSFYAFKTNTRSSPPDVTGFSAGKMVGEDTVITRVDETIGFIVIETGHATSSGTEIETGRTTTSVTNVPFSHTFSSAFASAPVVTVTSLVAMIGGNGGWGMIAGDATPTSIVVAVDEDQISDAERDHIEEPLDYVALSNPGIIPLTLVA